MKVSFDPWVVTIGRLRAWLWGGAAACQRIGPTKAVTCKALDFRLIFNDVHGGPKKIGTTVFYGCNFRSIDHHIGTKFGTNQRHFILNITSKLSNPDKRL